MVRRFGYFERLPTLEEELTISERKRFARHQSKHGGRVAESRHREAPALLYGMIGIAMASIGKRCSASVVVGRLRADPVWQAVVSAAWRRCGESSSFPSGAPFRMPLLGLVGYDLARAAGRRDGQARSELIYDAFLFASFLLHCAFRCARAVVCLMRSHMEETCSVSVIFLRTGPHTLECGSHS
jgi:hypothetical protein